MQIKKEFDIHFRNAFVKIISYLRIILQSEENKFIEYFLNYCIPLFEKSNSIAFVKYIIVILKNCEIDEIILDSLNNIVFKLEKKMEENKENYQSESSDFENLKIIEEKSPIHKKSNNENLSDFYLKIGNDTTTTKDTQTPYTQKNFKENKNFQNICVASFNINETQIEKSVKTISSNNSDSNPLGKIFENNLNNIVFKNPEIPIINNRKEKKQNMRSFGTTFTRNLVNMPKQKSKFDNKEIKVTPTYNSIFNDFSFKNENTKKNNYNKKLKDFSSPMKSEKNFFSLENWKSGIIVMNTPIKNGETFAIPSDSDD